MTEGKNFFEEFKAEKPESFEEEVFVANKSKKPIYFAFVIVVSVLLFAAFNYLNQVEVADMSSWNVSEVNAWSKKNKITLIGKQVYDNGIDKDMVVLQGEKAGQKIKKNGSIEVTFSKGANPDAAIEFPNMKTMKLEEIQNFIKSNKLSGVNIQYENSESIEKDTVISVNFIDGDMSNFIRKNRVKVIVSKGTAKLTETLTMPELYGKTKQEVLKWASDNKIKVELTEAYSDYIEPNFVVSQDITKDNKFNREETVRVVISLGQAIMVPNFIGLTSEEASNLANLYELRLFIKTVESPNEVGRIVYQSISNNENVKKNDIITLHVSKPIDTKVMPSFVGLTKASADEIIAVHGLKVIYEAVESTDKEVMVLEQSITPGTSIKEHKILTLTISDGSILVPNFQDMDKDAALVVAEDLGLKVLLSKNVSVYVRNNKIITQDIEVGSIVKKGTRVTLEYAENNDVKVVDLTKKSKEDAEFWAKTKGYTLRIIETYHRTIPKGTLYDQNFKSVYLPLDMPIVVYHSLGKIKVPDLTGKTKKEADDWLEEVNAHGGNVTVEYRNTGSSTYGIGQITTQTPLNKEIAFDEKVVFYICTSQNTPGTTVPDFTGLTSTEFINWCSINGISYSITDVYNSKITADQVYDQNYKNSISKSDVLKIKRSLGNIAVVDFTGKTKAEFNSWLSDVNSKGGGILVNYLSQGGGVTDVIVLQSTTTGVLPVGSPLTITISTGI